MAVKVYFKRTLSLIILVCFLTLLVFTSFNKAKEVKAEALSAVVLGVGCLAVLVASYFSASGIQLSQSGSESTTYFEDFINDSIQQFKEGDEHSKAIFDQYFDSEGRYIGSEEDLKFILSPSARGYWSMGKDLVSGLESFKSWFVEENNLTNGISTSIFSENSLDLHVSSANGTVVKKPTFELNQSFIIPSSATICNNFGNDTVTFYSSSGYYFTYTREFSGAPRVNTSLSIYDSSDNLVYSNTGRISNLYGTNYTNYSQNGLSILITSNGALYLSLILPSVNDPATINLYGSVSFGSYAQYFLSDISDISLEGTLTDGYQDFQDALDQDLANESENDDAVVVTGVGELGTDLTYDQIKELILQNVITGALNPTYEGTYENQEAAEEDLDKESPIVTPDWRPTPVIVNGLEDFFPFCIPFDLYAVIELLNTEPVAPKFTGHLDFAGIFQAQNIELDFSQFEYLARIVRVIIVIAFLIFIILKTRDMIRG